MKWFFLCLVIDLTIANSYKIVKLDWVVGRVTQVYFDSSLNTYAISSTSIGDLLYKFDSNNNFQFYFKFQGSVTSHIDEKDNHYISVYHFEDGTTNVFSRAASFRKLEPNSDFAELLFRYISPENPTNFRSFIDNNGNVIFNAEEGVAIWSPDYDLARVFGNLRGYAFHDHVIDKDGNIYFAAHLTEWKFLAVLTKKESMELYPTVKILSYAENPDSLIFWHNSIIMTEYQDSRGSIKVLRNESVDHLLSEYNVWYGNLMDNSLIPTENRLYVMRRKKSDKISASNLMYINKNFEIAKIKETIPEYITFHNGYASTKNGAVYFVTYDEKDGYYLLSLKPSEMTFNKIKIETDQRVEDIAVDRDDNLWILTKYLLCLKRDTKKPSIMSRTHLFSGGMFSFMKVKKETNEVYIYDNGFFVWTNTEPKSLKDFRENDPRNGKGIDTTHDRKYDIKSEEPESGGSGMSTVTIVLIVIGVIILIILALAFGCDVSD